MKQISSKFHWKLPEEHCHIPYSTICAQFNKKRIIYQYGYDRFTGNEQICFASKYFLDKAIQLLEELNSESSKTAHLLQIQKQAR